MRRGRLTAVCAAALAPSSVVAADTPVYPETAVDRPLVRYDGMTWLDTSYDFYTYERTGVDSNGNPRRTTQIDGNFDVLVGHSFGLVEVFGRVVGEGATLGAGAQVGCDGVVGVAATDYIPQTTYRYAYAQSFGYTQRLLRLEHRLAVFASAGGSFVEESLTPMNAPASAGTQVLGRAGASATVQLTDRLAFFGGLGVNGSIAKSSSLRDDRSTYVTGYVQLEQTIHQVDVYANFNFGDLPHAANPYWSAGLVYRWGG